MTTPRDRASSGHVARVNERLADILVRGFGSMWGAYALGVLGLIAIPDIVFLGVAGLAQWFAQTFLQLVLLSLILIAMRAQARAEANRAAALRRDVANLLVQVRELADTADALTVALVDTPPSAPSSAQD